MNQGPDWQPQHNPHRLYKNKDKRMLTGVCSGIADYTGLNRFLVRLLTIMLFFSPLLAIVFLAYIISAIVLPTKPPLVYANHEQETFWRGVSRSPTATFGNVRHQYRDLESRLRRMEAYVTSPGFEMDKELGNRREDP